VKEVKRLSDEVLLYKSWEESHSGHQRVFTEGPKNGA